MPEFKDAGHRDHARHMGEEPTTGIDRGPYGLTVTLDQWGPWSPSVMAAYLQSNWGDHPADPDQMWLGQDNYNMPPIVEACLNGQTLQQILEGITFWFTIDGVCRPATHQIVRTRDAAFMQHGGRDNDWRHRRFSMPETIARMCEADAPTDPSLKHCMTDRMPMAAYVDKVHALDAREAIEDYLARGKELYSALVDSGIPWQDARRLLPMGLQTYIHGIYPFRTLQHTLANRLEYIMDWEYNCVGQLMVRAVRMTCPKIVGDQFMSTSDKLRKAAFAGLESWPPDGKYPNPHERCARCDGLEDASIHRPGRDLTDTDPVTGDEHVFHQYVPKDALPRAHRPEQNPFWVLTEDALNGGSVEWIPTNGTYPHDNPKAPKAR